MIKIEVLSHVLHPFLSNADLLFVSSVDRRINGWNEKVANLNSLSDEIAIGKSLAQDHVYKEPEETVSKLLNCALKGI